MIGDIQVPTYILEDGTPVISARGLAKALGFKTESGRGVPLSSTSKPLKPFISKDLTLPVSNPLVFLTPDGNVAHGYDAGVLAELAQAIAFAGVAGCLHHNSHGRS